MTQAMPQIMRITPVGLPTQERTILGVAANLLAALDLEVQVLEEASPSANLAVVNGESAAGIRYLADPAGAALKIVIADQESQGQGQLLLARPVRVQGLKDAIYDLWSSRQERPEGGSPAPAAAVDGTGADTLFAAMLLARRGQQVVEFSPAVGPPVLLDGTKALYYSEQQDKALEAIARQGGTSRPLSQDAAQGRIHGHGGHPFADLVWMAAWFGGQGVAGSALPPGRPLRLRTFPRLPKLFLRPEYVRVAAMLTKAPLAPQQLAQASGVALERVLEFCHIAEVLGILEAAEGSLPTRPAAAPRAAGGLLAKLARRLSSGIGARG
jgi:hypothetical protein